MDNNKKLIAAMISALFVSACASTQTSDSVNADTQQEAMMVSDIEKRTQQLNEREAQLSRAQAELDTQRANSSSMTAPSSIEQLLPPKAIAGECYARVWVKPTYVTNNATILVSEASEKVSTSPAEYETVTEQVLVKEASSYMNTVPAVYGTETESRLVEEGQRSWRVDLGKSAAPASDELLAAAENHGINLDSATPGTCYHEHYIPAQYETVSEQVLVEEAYDQVSASEATYNWVEKEVLVREASTKLVSEPAVYETVAEQIIDKPAHTIWKKGTGPIQRIDEATGEIMCLVEVPATYKTISKRVLKTAAATSTTEVPAQYKAVKVRELVSGPAEIRNQVPAKYKALSSVRKTEDRSFAWHEIHNKEHTYRQ